jgi:5-methylthioribose kinase
MSIEKITEQIGETINGQLTYTWNTQQTLEQYAEVLEGEEITLEGFLEYVRDNVFEILAEYAGREAIRQDIYLVDQYGTPIEEMN